MIDNKTIRDHIILKKMFPGNSDPTYETRTASGAIASFTTNVAAPVSSCLLTINPLQTGTGDPSPTNPRPITGFTGVNVTRCGKNLFDKTSGQVLNAYFGAALTENSVTRTVYVKCSPNTTYTVSKTAGQRFAFGYTKELPAIGVSVFGGVADNTASSITITTGADAKYLVAYVFNGNSDSGTADEMLASVQIEQGSTATTYEAYTGTTYTISWQTEAGTVYGGELNATTGVLTITWGIVDMGDLTWLYDSNNVKFYTTISDIVNSSGYNQPSPLYCSCYNVINQVGQGSSVADKTIYLQYNVNQKVWCKDTDYTTSEGFTTSVEGQKLVYKLATPTEVQLTPTEVRTLLGENNIWHDCNGDSTVEYLYQTGEGGGINKKTFLPFFYPIRKSRDV